MSLNTIFEAKDDFSLGEDVLKTMGAEGSLPGLSAYFESAIATSLLVKSGKDVKKLSTAWLSLFLKPGTVVYNVNDGGLASMTYVVDTCDKGGTTWSVKPVVAGSQRIITFSRTGHTALYKYLHIHSLEGWRAIELTSLPPAS